MLWGKDLMQSLWSQQQRRTRECGARTWGWGDPGLQGEGELVGSLFCKERELGWASGRGKDGGFEKGLRRTEGKVSKLYPLTRKSAEEGGAVV